MKIDYKVLWLDDQIKNFEDDELVDELKAYLIEAGFRPIIDTVNNSASFFELLDVSYDLILTDFHMQDMQGDKVVEKIRSSEYSILTEILFYTAKANLKGADKISRVSFLETSKKTGRSHQDVVLEEAKKLIAITIKKFQHIVAMRGMIMHETSSLDTQMVQILRKFIQNENNATHTREIATQILDDLEKLFSSKLDNIRKWKSNTNLNKASQDNFVFSAEYKIRTMGEILKTLGEEDFSADYNERINKTRNKFAHAVLEKDPTTGREFFRQGNTTFDEALCKKIREDIRQHDEKLKHLAQKI